MFDPMCVTTKKVLKNLGGDKISGKVYTFDGNTEGKYCIPESPMYKISNDTPDLSKVSSIRITTEDGIMDVPASQCTINTDAGAPALLAGDLCAVIVVENNIFSDMEVENGLYVVCYPDDVFYTSSIEFAETIVPIDQKYLPGVCLPVVELSTEPTTEGAVLTAEESAKLDKVAALKLPIIVKFNLAGDQMAMTAMWHDGANAFMILMGYSAFTITKDSDTWLFMMEG